MKNNNNWVWFSLSVAAAVVALACAFIAALRNSTDAALFNIVCATACVALAREFRPGKM